MKKLLYIFSILLLTVAVSSCRNAEVSFNEKLNSTIDNLCSMIS